MIFKDKPIFFDGAMGTALQAQGLRGGENPENWNITRPDVLINLHRQYLRAGCDVITANTFGANPLKLENCAETVSAAVKNVKKAIELEGKDALCALDIGPSGKLLQPNGDLSFEDAVRAFAVPICAGVKAGADLIIIETFTDPYEMKAAILAAKENSDLPVVASFSPDMDGKLLTGGNLDVAACLAQGLGADALGLNCGFGGDVMLKFARQLSQLSSLPLLVMPNAGLPKTRDGSTYFDVSPKEFARQMAQIARVQGVAALGGCCGTTPEHLRETIALCGEIPVTPPTLKEQNRVCSYARTTTLGEGRCTIIGERINPTGKKLLQAALRENDWEYIAALGIKQRDEGADILDLNCGLPDIDEMEAMRKGVAVLQAAVSLPLQLDSASAEVMALGMREYNGIPLVNSVSGKEESLSTVLPLVKKYGGSLVCLTLDEKGIPETPEGRLAIAEKIVNRAEMAGISRRRLLIDPLCMSVSADKNAAKITLAAIRLIKEKLCVSTILGVSNVSFGLPNREAVNGAFFARALEAGLDAAILNPAVESMQTALLTHRLLAGEDENCGEYIAKMGGAETVSAQAAQSANLRSALLNGLEAQSYALTQKELEGGEPNGVISKILIPVLEEVGEKFAAGTLFLPQLMQSARAAQEVSRAVREHMEKRGEIPESRGKIALATVEGDVHDIGKNIVKVMLENYGFSVLDLGKNVAPQEVLSAVREEKIRLVGLSALMTTTVPAMEKTITLLKASVPEVRVLVGGAVLSAKSAQAMGADGYADDAMGAVRAFESAGIENK
ncbi:MAG: homocysteine S-methyltransferase family protein [Oscillospiraceae bacterium]|nr:homocysteine S-methyltransferase family protein [Oscillospiraceae bacterium]